MKKTLDILLTAIILILAGCQDKPSLDPVTGPSESYPIQFGISADLEVESKSALIEGDIFDENGNLVKEGNYKDFGFIALSNLTVDANSDRQPSIFGANGTEVKYVSNAWTYSPLRFWQIGTYNFAGVMPSSIFNATHNHTATTQPGTSIASLTETTDGSQLTLNFGPNGFNLAETQTDLMVAFSSQTVQSSASAGRVDFDFTHQLALINIEVQIGDSPTDIVVNNINIYGNRQVATVATFVNISSGNDATIIAEWALGSRTTADNCYHQVTGTKIENLLVFPESDSDILTVAVSYTESYGTSTFFKTKYGEIDINWQAGKIYTYKTILTSDSIVFGAPTVSDWSNGGAADDIPQM